MEAVELARAASSQSWTEGNFTSTHGTHDIDSLNILAIPRKVLDLTRRNHILLAEMRVTLTGMLRRLHTPPTSKLRTIAQDWA